MKEHQTDVSNGKGLAKETGLLQNLIQRTE